MVLSLPCPRPFLIHMPATPSSSLTHKSFLSPYLWPLTLPIPNKPICYLYPWIDPLLIPTFHSSHDTHDPFSPHAYDPSFPHVQDPFPYPGPRCFLSLWVWLFLSPFMRPILSPCLPHHPILSPCPLHHPLLSSCLPHHPILSPWLPHHPYFPHTRHITPSSPHVCPTPPLIPTIPPFPLPMPATSQLPIPMPATSSSSHDPLVVLPVGVLSNGARTQSRWKSTIWSLGSAAHRVCDPDVCNCRWKSTIWWLGSAAHRVCDSDVCNCRWKSTIWWLGSAAHRVCDSDVCNWLPLCVQCIAVLFRDISLYVTVCARCYLCSIILFLITVMLHGVNSTATGWRRTKSLSLVGDIITWRKLSALSQQYVCIIYIIYIYIIYIICVISTLWSNWGIATHIIWSILVMWLECRFLDMEVDRSNPAISMLCPWARHCICIASVDSVVKWVPGGDNLVKGVRCYELFGGIALKSHAFFSSQYLRDTNV